MKTEQQVRDELAVIEAAQARHRADMPQDYRRMSQGVRAVSDGFRVAISTLRWVLGEDQAETKG